MKKPQLMIICENSGLSNLLSISQHSMAEAGIGSSSPEWHLARWNFLDESCGKKIVSDPVVQDCIRHVHKGDELRLHRPS